MSSSRSTSRWQRSLSGLLFLGILTACGGGGGSDGGGSLLVIDTVPVDGGVLEPTLPGGGARSHEVKILFSSEPDRATVLDPAAVGGLGSNVRIVDTSQRRLSGVAFLGGLSADGRTPEEIDPNVDPAWAAEIAADEPEVLRVVHDTDGRLGTAEALLADQYTFRVTQGVTGKGGGPLVEPYCGSFTVGPDIYAPVVMVTDPVDGEVDVSIHTDIIVEFNESVVPSTVTGSGPSPAIQVMAQATGGSGGNPALPITGTITRLVSNGCRFRFTPDSPLPGSSAGSAVLVTAMVQGGMVTDPAGNVMANPDSSTFTMERGPTIGNNPVPPNALWFGATGPAQVGVIGVNTVETTTGTAGMFVDTDGDGVATAADDNALVPNSINNAVGIPGDLVLGSFVTPGNGVDVISNPNPPLPLPLGSSTTALPSICGMAASIQVPNSVNADIGNYVYVVDTDSDRLRVLNSNTSLEVDAIPLPDPTGATITADLSTVLVSNFGTNSVSVINVAQNANTVLKEVTVNPNDPALAVGRGPRAIAAQPDMEDVLVLNARDDSMSVLSIPAGFEVRKVVASNIGPDPFDVGATWRGVSGTYFAYVTNRAGNSISVFESGPTFPVMAGPDDIKGVLQDSPTFHIRRPMEVHADLTTGMTGEGVWFVNNEDGTVGQIVLTFIGPPPNPYFPNPAPNRVWGMNRLVASLGTGAVDLAMGDNVVPCFLFPPNSNMKNNFGHIRTPLKGYVALANEVAVFDARNGLDLGTRIPVPGVRTLATYFNP